MATRQVNAEAGAQPRLDKKKYIITRPHYYTYPKLFFFIFLYIFSNAKCCINNNYVAFGEINNAVCNDKAKG